MSIDLFIQSLQQIESENFAALIKIEKQLNYSQHSSNSLSYFHDKPRLMGHAQVHARHLFNLKSNYFFKIVLDFFTQKGIINWPSGYFNGNCISIDTRSNPGEDIIKEFKEFFRNQHESLAFVNLEDAPTRESNPVSISCRMMLYAFPSYGLRSLPIDAHEPLAVSHVPLVDRSHKITWTC